MLDHHAGTAQDEEKDYRPSEEAEPRLRQLRVLEDQKLFEPFAGASAHLNSHLRGRALNACGDPVDISDYLERVVQHGNPELVAEASLYLEGSDSKAGALGGEPEVVTTAPVWDKTAQVARGKVTIGDHVWN